MLEHEIIGLTRLVSIFTFFTMFFCHSGMVKQLYRRISLFLFVGTIAGSMLMSDGVLLAVYTIIIIALLPALISPLTFVIQRLQMSKFNKIYGSGSIGIATKFDMFSIYRFL